MGEISDFLKHAEKLGFVNAAAPKEYANHPLIRGKTFYTLPVALLDQLEKQLGSGVFDADSWRLERALAEQLQPVARLVGFVDGVAIEYELLPLKPLPLPQPDGDTLKRLKRPLNEAQYRLIRKSAEERLGFFWQAQRGYAGWLVTNRQFLEERDSLLATWWGKLREHGLPQAKLATSGAILAGFGFRRLRGSQNERFFNAFETFYARWRLSHMVTPELPVPIAPQIPVVTPQSVMAYMNAGGVTLYQPDTMPIPSRDMLRDVLDDIRTSHHAEHLRGWLNIVRKSRPNDRAVLRYGRILALHHYWTVLSERHPDLIGRRGNVGPIQRAFAKFLSVDAKTVEKDRQHIRRRLA